MVGEEGDADARLQLDAQLFGLERRRQHLAQLGHRLLGLAHGERRQQHAELVAAQPRHHQAALGGRRLEPSRDLHQQAVADVVAEGVVDVLEAVEVEQRHRQPA